MIARAHLTVAETAEVGEEITNELKRNREKIESSRAKVTFPFLAFEISYLFQSFLNCVF